MIDQGAEFSPDRRYRYRLWRAWGTGPRLMVIGLNPSTADETADDPTVRRCIGYARAWGYGGLEMTNLFAFRATDPRAMLREEEPIGTINHPFILIQARIVADDGGGVLAAWGAHGLHLCAGNSLACGLIDAGIGAACLGFTKAMEPRHPLYLPKTAQPVPFVGDGGRLVTERRAAGQ